MDKKTVLITGCSTGFGKLAAKKFQTEGWNVIATMRSPEKETELTELNHVFVTKLDVTNDTSVSEAVAKGVEKFGRIDALINNAGISGVGVFEQWDERKIYSMFETNVLGLMRVTKAILPLMRKQGEGVVINISSTAGLVGSPFSSVYTSILHELENNN